MAIGLRILAGAILFAGAARADDFPAGPAHDLVARTCTQCHGADQVTGQHRTKDQWSDTVNRMLANGAQMSDADAGTITAYLAAHFAAR